MYQPRSTPASLPLKGQIADHTTVKWTILDLCGSVPDQFQNGFVQTEADPVPLAGQSRANIASFFVVYFTG